MSGYEDLERPPLDPAVLAATMVGPGTWWREVSVLAETGSTNADLAARARADAPEGTAIATDHQLTGRGRLDRGWQAPPRSGLAVSMLVRPDTVPAGRWPWLPLLVGLVVEESLRSATGVDAGLKWPNDVLVDGRKLAGILVERVETPTGPAAVIGVGINVSLSSEELPVPTATSLALAGATTLDRAIILRALLRTFEALYRAWAATDGDPAAGIHASYVRRCVTVGSHVRVRLPDGKLLDGVAEAIDSTGQLVVNDGAARQSLSAGDVVHVRSRT